MFPWNIGRIRAATGGMTWVAAVRGGVEHAPTANTTAIANPLVTPVTLAIATPGSFVVLRLNHRNVPPGKGPQKAKHRRGASNGIDRHSGRPVLRLVVELQIELISPGLARRTRREGTDAEPVSGQGLDDAEQGAGRVW